MLTEKASELLEGTCEVDETYIGGSESNKHASRRTVRVVLAIRLWYQVPSSN
jgi:hypothetical protein